MIAYKLTGADGYTRRGQAGETLWEVDSTVKPQGEGTGPCGPGVLHLYASPEEAVLYNPIHANIGLPRLFLVEAAGIAGDDGLKQWTTGSVQVVEELDMPEITTEERVAFAICISPHVSTREWAVGWLLGADRSAAAAYRTAAELLLEE